MFTGIVEEIGKVQSIDGGNISSSLYIECSKVLEETKIGDSIAVNGVCLTVVKILENGFKADVMPETLKRSNLGNLSIDSEVNLERALTFNSIDGVGKIISFERDGNAVWISISADFNLLKYIIFKGSITVDGVSLTVAYIDNEIFKVSIIPHTEEETILLKKSIGSFVNLECDLIAKYVEKLLDINKKTEIKDIDKNFLLENGFL